MKKQITLTLFLCLLTTAADAQPRNIYACGPSASKNNSTKSTNLKKKLEANDKALLQELATNHISCSFSYSPEGQPINIKVVNPSGKQQLSKLAKQLIEREAPSKYDGKGLFKNWIMTIKFVENQKVAISTTQPAR